MPLIAGTAEIGAVMDTLATERQVFHSEADFQHAFAWVVHCLSPELQVRLEVRQADRKYLDLVIHGPKGKSMIELKYPTARWDGIDPQTSERFALSHHGAPDLARRNYVFDIDRLQRFCQQATEAVNGMALLLTNDRSLWAPPATTRSTRDEEFRIHEGRTLSGTLEWAQGRYPANRRHLTGTHLLQWQPFALLPEANGEFRWLAVEINSHQGVR